MFGFGKRKKEERAVYTTSATDFAESMNLVQFLQMSASDVPVTTDKALGVPAVWTAVNFIAGTIAGLPLHIYQRKRNGSRERVKGGIAPILHDAINEQTTSFAWRKYTFEQVLTYGRAFTFIERNARNQVMNLWPLDPTGVQVKRREGRTFYEYREQGRLKRYDADEIIDLPFALTPDGLGHRSPIMTNKDAIGLAIAATNYASKFFQGGGVPPFMITGNFQSGYAMKRAAEDLEAAVKKASQERRQAVVLPAGLDVKPIGGNPEQNQLIEAKRFSVEEIARIYSLPPVFLQDLTRGTFSNTEQQDLHFVKHTIKRWIEQFEQEMTLKLFGRGANQYVEFSVDGLLRGDFKTRMEGYAQAIQHGHLTPNEAREMENRPAMDGGDKLLIQGATVPLDAAGQAQGDDNGI